MVWMDRGGAACTRDLEGGSTEGEKGNDGGEAKDGGTERVQRKRELGVRIEGHGGRGRTKWAGRVRSKAERRQMGGMHGMLNLTKQSRATPRSAWGGSAQAVGLARPPAGKLAQTAHRISHQGDARRRNKWRPGGRRRV